MSSTPRRKVTKKTSTSDASVDLTAPVDAGVDRPDMESPTSPAMPHERDEAVGMTGGVPSPRVQQGERDLKRGLQDTSRATEADTAYRKLKK